VKRYYCTYFDRNYLVRALALIESLNRHEKNPFQLFAVCLDEISRTILTGLALPNVTPVAMSDIEHGDDELLAAKGNRSTVEYYWTSTPTIILRIIERNPEIDILTYVDADIYFFSSPDPIYDELGDRSVLIHEHRFPPRLAHMVEYGRYNVGVLCFRNDPHSIRVLEWWRERCLEWCYGHVENGKYGDQAYLDDWLTRFDRVTVLRNVGAGVAPWNHEQYSYSEDAGGKALVDGTPLVFYHYHSLAFVTPGIIIPLKYTIFTATAEIIRLCFLPYMHALRRALFSLPSNAPTSEFGLLTRNLLTIEHTFLADSTMTAELRGAGLPQLPVRLDTDWDCFCSVQLEDFTEIVKDGGGLARYFIELGRGYQDKGDARRASEFMKQALSHDPGNTRARLELAKICYHCQNFTEALDYLRELVVIKREDPEVWTFLLLAADQLKIEDAVQAAYLHLHVLDPNNKYLQALSLSIELSPDLFGTAPSFSDEEVRSIGQLLAEAIARNVQRPTGSGRAKRGCEHTSTIISESGEEREISSEAGGEGPVTGFEVAVPRPLPKLSIVTPSFNQAEFIEETIDSVLSQGYPNLEYIIMDGGSTDGSVEIIKKYERYLKYWQSCPDGGHYPAVNAGFKRCSGEIMAWLNSDDRYFPEAFHRAVSALSEDHDCQWIMGRPTLFYRDGGYFDILSLVPRWSREYLLSGTWEPLNLFIQQESTFWKRSLWEKAGATLRTDLRLAGDFELWVRFSRYAKLKFVDVLLGSFRFYDTQRSKVLFGDYLKEAHTVAEDEFRLYPAMRVRLGRMCRERQLYQQALTYLQSAVDADPGDVEGWVEMARLSSRLKVEKIFNMARQRVHALDPHHPALARLECVI